MQSETTAFEVVLILYSIITPFDAFEISFENIMKKWSICSFGANASFSKAYKNLFQFFLNFSMLSKNRK